MNETQAKIVADMFREQIQINADQNRAIQLLQAQVASQRRIISDLVHKVRELEFPLK